jgi:hypothetical protein
MEEHKVIKDISIRIVEGLKDLGYYEKGVSIAYYYEEGMNPHTVIFRLKGGIFRFVACQGKWMCIKKKRDIVKIDNLLFLLHKVIPSPVNPDDKY